jgi:hypothetical protein
MTRERFASVRPLGGIDESRELRSQSPDGPRLTRLVNAGCLRRFDFSIFEESATPLLPRVVAGFREFRRYWRKPLSLQVSEGSQVVIKGPWL